MKESFKQKKARILTDMTLKDAKNKIMEAGKAMIHPPIDLEKAKRLMQELNPVPGLETERYLFSFKGKFHLVESKQYRKIDQSEASNLIGENAGMKLYYLCTNEGMCPLPPAFVNTEAKGVQLKNDAEVVDFINKTAGVTITTSDL